MGMLSAKEGGRAGVVFEVPQRGVERIFVGHCLGSQAGVGVGMVERGGSRVKDLELWVTGREGGVGDDGRMGFVVMVFDEKQNLWERGLWR